MEKNDSQMMDRRTFIKSVGLGTAAILGGPAVVAAQSGRKADPMVSAKKIDVFTHVLPPKYKDALFEVLPEDNYFRGDIMRFYDLFYDMEKRKQAIDIPGYAQVLTLMSPFIDQIADPETAVRLAKIANDGMAEIVSKDPDKFVAAVAALPLNNMKASLEETDRCIKELGFKGIQIPTPICDKPLDSPEFIPLYERMAEYDLPIWIHPARTVSFADYRSETMSYLGMFLYFGWPYETTLAMVRLVYSGILEKYPDLKFITHHGGAMIPFFHQRIPKKADVSRLPHKYAKLSRPGREYFKKFFVDTANIDFGAVNLSYQYYGPNNVMFGTDYPFGPPLKNTIGNIDRLDIGCTEKANIFENNTKRMLRLT